MGVAFGLNWPSLERTRDMTERVVRSAEKIARVLERERLRRGCEETPKSVKYEEERSSPVMERERESAMMMMMATGGVGGKSGPEDLTVKPSSVIFRLIFLRSHCWILLPRRWLTWLENVSAGGGRRRGRAWDIPLPHSNPNSAIPSRPRRITIFCVIPHSGFRLHT